MKRVIPDQHIFLQLWERCKSAKGPSLYLFSVACPINMYLVNPGHTLWLPGHICAHDYAHFGHVMHTRKHISNLHAQNAHNDRHKCVWACTHIFLVRMNWLRVHSEKRNAAEQRYCLHGSTYVPLFNGRFRWRSNVQLNRAILLAESHKLNPWSLDEGPRPKSGKSRLKTYMTSFWR
jgi:hypothetical protein